MKRIILISITLLTLFLTTACGARGSRGASQSGEQMKKETANVAVKTISLDNLDKTLSSPHGFSGRETRSRSCSMKGDTWNNCKDRDLCSAKGEEVPGYFAPGSQVVLRSWSLPTSCLSRSRPMAPFPWLPNCRVFSARADGR